MTHKVIIAGGRNFDKYDLLCSTMKELFNKDDIEVVSGTARGADRLGELWAEDNNVPVKRFPADWNGKGKAAGYIRNAEMAVYADTLVAFWDGTSKGTEHMIKLAHKNNLSVHVIRYT